MAEYEARGSSLGGGGDGVVLALRRPGCVHSGGKWNSLFAEKRRLQFPVSGLIPFNFPARFHFSRLPLPLSALASTSVALRRATRAPESSPSEEVLAASSI